MTAQAISAQDSGSARWSAPWLVVLLGPLALRDFRLYWLGRTVSGMGDRFQTVALAMLALELTGSGVGLASVLAVQAVPRVLLILLGGAVTDRYRPRTVILATDVVQALVTACLAGLTLTHHLAQWHLFVYAATTGVVGALSMPATNSINTDLVPQRMLRSASALTSLSLNLTFLLAAPLAGMTVALVGVGPAILLNAASFAGSASLVLPMKLPSSGKVDEANLLSRLVRSIRGAANDEAIWLSIVLVGVFMLGFSGATDVAIPTLAKQSSVGGEMGMGILVGARGAGALLGVFIAGGVSKVARPGLVGSLASVGCGAALLAAGLAPTLWLAALCMVAVGACTAAYAVLVRSLVQSRAPDGMRGGVMSLFVLALSGLTPLSYVISGLASDALGPHGAFLVAGALVVGGGCIGLMRRATREATYRTA